MASISELPKNKSTLSWVQPADSSVRCELSRVVPPGIRKIELEGLLSAGGTSHIQGV